MGGRRRIRHHSRPTNHHYPTHHSLHHLDRHHQQCVGLLRRHPACRAQAVQHRADDRHRHHRHRLVRVHRRRQLHGHDFVQDRQTAADHQQLLPLLAGRRRFRDRAHLHAALHRQHHRRLLAPRPHLMRLVAGSGLFGVERVCLEPAHHQLRQVLQRDEAVDLQSEKDDL